MSNKEKDIADKNWIQKQLRLEAETPSRWPQWARDECADKRIRRDKKNKENQTNEWPRD